MPATLADVTFTDEASAQAAVGKPLGDTGLTGVSVHAEAHAVPAVPNADGFLPGRQTVTLYRVHFAGVA
jgi:hypothetical protein